MCRWVKVSFVPGDYPDKAHAESAARIMDGPDLILVQSVASWDCTEEEWEAMERRRQQAHDREE